MIDENGVERENCKVHLPDDVEWTTPDGIFIKGMIMAKKGTTVAQHSHTYAHTSLIVKGSVRVWAEGELKGDFKAPYAIIIPAKTKHKFQALEDGTDVYCIHNVSKTGDVKIHEENSLEFV